MRNLKFQISSITLLTLLFFFSTPTEASAVIQNLNSQFGQSQSFQNDANVTISSSNDIHSIIWSGLLPISRGGTGVSAFTNGSIPFIFNGTFSQDNSNLFWDNINKRLGIGTTTPSAALEVSGDAKINGLTVGLGGGSVIYNTAVGLGTLSSNTIGSENVAIGLTALSSNTEGYFNTAVGSRALGSNVTGTDNTAVGMWTLKRHQSGNRNSAFGSYALSESTSGIDNTAIGTRALLYNNGNYNVAVGSAALESNTTGGANVALGKAALLTNSTGEGNIALGYDAGRWQADGTILSSPTSSIYIGLSSRGYNNNDINSIVLGANAIGAGANTTVIGNSSMADVYFGSSSANANVHGKKLFLGSSSVPGCIVMGDSDSSGVTYLTVNDGVLSASTTVPSACQ
jgi:hypothetical protein